MKRSPLSYSVALLLFLFVLRPITPGIAGEDEQSPHILQIGSPVIAVSTDDRTKQQEEEEEEYREAREAYEQEMEVEHKRQKFERAMEENKSKAREAERKSVTDTIEQSRSDPAKWRVIVVRVQMALGRFGYGIGPFDGMFDEKTRRALREYQAYNALSPTGAIHPQTFMKIHDDMNVLALAQFPVRLPRYQFADAMWELGSVLAEGTWTVLNAPNAELETPLQATQVSCSRQKMICTEETAFIRPTFRNEVSLITPLTRDYVIAQWDEHEIITKPADNKFECTRTSLRISRLQESVTRIQSPITNELKSYLCRRELRHDFEFRLVDGTRVQSDLSNRHRESVSSILRLDQSLLKDLR